MQKKAAEKHGMNNVRKFKRYLRNTQIQGEFTILSQDTHLFLPYDLTAHRHLPFLGSSPRVGS